MRTAELDYDLPPELVAQTPAEPRDAARLLVYRRADRSIEHRTFRELPDLLDPSDLLVVNTSRVMSARVRLRRPGGGSAEILLLEPLGSGGEWEALARPTRRMRAGMTLASDGLRVDLVEHLEGGRWRVRPSLTGPALMEALDRVGEMPLPPYIRARPPDPGRYQTVYADAPGSAAAPTAGLHVTPQMWDTLRARCDVVEVELRIGLDTFRPVSEDLLESHTIHSERYRVDAGAARAIAEARAQGRRIVALGTTATRVLETLARPDAPREGRTSIFITPGYRFAVTGALVTNFHLPRSTLLALVMAFAGVEEMRRVYAVAVAEGYRFFSFGDASLLL